MPTGVRYDAPPVVANGTVFAANVAVSADTGEEAWRLADLPGQVRGSPAVSGGTGYYCLDSGHLAAVDLANGSVKWTFEAAEMKAPGTPCVSEGAVYFGTMGLTGRFYSAGKLYAVDAETGAQLWEFDARAAVRSSPAVSHGRVYFGAEDGKIRSLDAKTGAEIWTAQLVCIGTAPAVSDSGTVVVCSDRLYVLAAPDGALAWSSEPAKATFETSSPAVGEGVLVAVMRSGKVLVYGQ